MREHDYLLSIKHLAKGYLVMAEVYYNYHASGFADLKDAFQLPDVGQYEFVEALLNQINDDELTSAFHSIKVQLQQLREVDEDITKWLGEYVGLATVESGKEKRRLEQRLKKIIVNRTEGYGGGPVWILNPEFQSLVERSKTISSNVSTTQQKIDRRIQQLEGTMLSNEE